MTRPRPGRCPALRAALPAAALAWQDPAPPAGAPADDGCLAARSVPAAVRPFVAPGACAAAVEQADLDRDGRADYVVVVARRRPAGVEAWQDEAPRALLVLVAEPGGGVRLAARNDRLVLCPGCGGVMGDPFVGVQARAGAFTVQHYGGSAWRWATTVTFAYSRRDRAWQLVRVEEDSFHASDATKVNHRVATPPRHFGKIDLRDFDPERWRGRGAR